MFEISTWYLLEHSVPQRHRSLSGHDSTGVEHDQSNHFIRCDGHALVQVQCSLWHSVLDVSYVAQSGSSQSQRRPCELPFSMAPYDTTLFVRESLKRFSASATSPNFISMSIAEFTRLSWSRTEIEILWSTSLPVLIAFASVSFAHALKSRVMAISLGFTDISLNSSGTWSGIPLVM